MTPEDRKPFLEVVIGFAELKGKQLSAPALELYWNAMQHWPLDAFRAAAQQLVRSCQFMPTPKDFEDLRKASAPTPGEAWALVLDHCRGAYRSGKGIDDGGPIDTAVRGLGGYKAIALYDSDYLGALERRFAERLSETQDALEIRAALPNLPRSSGLQRLGHA